LEWQQSSPDKRGNKKNYLTIDKTPKKLSFRKTLSNHDLIEEKYPEALKTLNGLLKINPRLYDVYQNWVKVEEFAKILLCWGFMNGLKFCD